MVVTMPPLDIRQPPEGALELLILVCDGTDNEVRYMSMFRQQF